jgi:hypothetical protein
MTRIHNALHVVGRQATGSTRPFVVETDAGRFVLKLLHGAEGPRALAAEWICAGIAAELGLPTLELAPIAVDPAIARSVVDSEEREMIERGAGLCLGSRVIESARAADVRLLDAAPDDFAERVLFLDVLVENPDRRRANPNVLAAGKAIVPIDHGAALPFHHEWRLVEEAPDVRVPDDHLFATRRLRAFDVPGARLEAICASVPEPWLGPIVFESADRQRAAYAAVLWKRLAALR